MDDHRRVAWRNTDAFCREAKACSLELDLVDQARVLGFERGDYPSQAGAGPRAKLVALSELRPSGLARTGGAPASRMVKHRVAQYLVKPRFQLGPLAQLIRLPECADERDLEQILSVGRGPHPRAEEAKEGLPLAR
jgi:hypothetical protein